jgi:hypothetical protein
MANKCWQMATIQSHSERQYIMKKLMSKNSLHFVPLILIVARSCLAFPPAGCSLDMQKRRQFMYQSLRVRGGSSSINPPPSSPSVSSTAAQTAVSAAALNTDKPSSNDKEKYLRNAQELFKHVWPPVPKKIKDADVGLKSSSSIDIQKERQYALGIRLRVIFQETGDVPGELYCC